MAFAHVQDKSASNATAAQASIAVTLGANITSGNLLVAVVYTFSSGATPTVSSITGGGTWTASDVTVQDGNANPARLTMGHCTSATGGTATVTATFSSNSDGQLLWVGEYSGQAGSPLDTTHSNHTSGVTSSSVTPGSITPAVANELFVAAMYDYTGTATVTQPTGWTIRVTNDSNTSLSVAELISTGSASQNPTWTLSSPDDWASAMIAFKPFTAPHGLAAQLLFVGQSVPNAVSF